MSNLFSMHGVRILVGVFLAATTLTVVISRNLEDPDLQTAVASALAAEHRLIEVALDQYPRQGPAIVVTYGQLPLFREQLARFGPQVVPIVAAYQQSFTTVDALQLAQEAGQALFDRLASWFTLVQGLVAPAEAADPNEEETVEDRGLLASLLDRLASWFTPARWLGAPVADAPEIAGEAADPNKEQAVPENDAGALDRLSSEDRGLLALFNMRDEGNAFVGQWTITADGEASRIPSRVVMLEGPELLAGGLTALERRIFQEREVDWPTYRDAIADVAAIASGATALRFLKNVPQGIRSAPAATKTATLRSGAREVASVLGIKAVRYGLPIGLVALMVLHPGVFTHYLCVLAESFGMPCILGPLVGWGIVIVPLAFLLSWMLLSVRLLRFAARLFAGVARGCQLVAGRLAAAGEHRSS